MKDIDDAIADLRLAPFGQDWGIICADAARLDEFTDYFVRHCEAFDDGTRGEVLELVLASADEAIRADSNCDVTVRQQVDRALAVCRAEGGLVILILEYWRDHWSGDQHGNLGRPSLYQAVARRLTR